MCLKIGWVGVAAWAWWPALLTPSAWALQDIVTESNQFDLVGFIPLLRERIYSNNQYARQFIISWVGTHSPTRPKSRILSSTSIPCLGKQQTSVAMREHRQPEFTRAGFLSQQSFSPAALKPQLPVSLLL